MYLLTTTGKVTFNSIDLLFEFVNMNPDQVLAGYVGIGDNLGLGV